MQYSASNITSSTVVVPMCDAWGHIRADTSVSTLDSSGVSAVSVATVGLYNIDFSNPQRFSSGGYVVLYTPEVLSETCMLSYQRDMEASPRGSTAAASTSRVQISTWRFPGPVGPGGNTAQQSTFPSSSTYINFAAFSLSTDSQLRTPAGGTYALVPGASGYGISGATYFSPTTNALSKRTATAYGTVVIPKTKSNMTGFCAFLENSYNTLRVEAVDGGPEYDVYFSKPMNNTNYAVILCAETEHIESSSGLPHINEYSLPIIVRGESNQHKTRNKFRIRHIKQNSDNNSWQTGNFLSMHSGITEKIHFMVFGGGTYGQP